VSQLCVGGNTEYSPDRVILGNGGNKRDGIDLQTKVFFERIPPLEKFKDLAREIFVSPGGKNT
jgi:hypothetical protein